MSAFGPLVYTQASRRDLRGRVWNDTTGVSIEVEGNHGDIVQFVTDLKANAPPLSAKESVECNHNLAPVDYPDFVILESVNEPTDREQFVPISADVATCDDCLKELLDPQDRRYRYPFINCTNCGPRFTIIEDIPYDRARTTMCEFDMCDDCRAEYEDPLNRRFHAEPTACHVCGPRLLLSATSNNDPVAPAGSTEKADTAEGPHQAVSIARDLLLTGHILAIKGIGGVHLSCDALNQEAVERLRQRKYREDKPFAMMASSVAVIRQYCEVSQEEEDLLCSVRRPIVLLERKPGSIIPLVVAPRVNNLGFMLPYSPLHHLLLKDLDRPLVMTSGNVSYEPICFGDKQAVNRLGTIADYFLLHDRRIHMRTDDSVARVHDGREVVLRRSRGYAPEPIKTAFRFETQILACGAELKNTFCLTRDHYAFVSYHIGDLENLETLQSFTEGIDHFQRLFHLHAEVVAYDLHPEYLSTKYALAIEDIAIRIPIQHHHAHVASCMADNEIEGEVIGVAMDGLGYGTDGRLWGGEFFVADFVEAECISHLAEVPMPGSAKAIREPWRMAAVYLQQAFGTAGRDLHNLRRCDARARFKDEPTRCQSFGSGGAHGLFAAGCFEDCEKEPGKANSVFGLGFETTAPSSALTVLQAAKDQVNNFSLFCNHITIIPALKAMLDSPDLKLDRFLGPGHVSTVIGTRCYDFVPREYGKPIVVTGFEPLDIVQSVAMIVKTNRGRPRGS